MTAQYGYWLENISNDGLVPVTRMGRAIDTQDFVLRLIQDDIKRSRFRAAIDGLCDGNPPYKRELLRQKNRSRDCNVNWGTARAYLESGSGAIYDLATQAPGLISIETSFGQDNPQARVQWQRDMCAAADLILQTDPDWDGNDQISQLEMTLHGNGPLWFEDEYKVLPVSVETSDLKVPDRSRSLLSRWEVAVILRDYSPPELYELIANEEMAMRIGWNPEFTKKVISNAMDVKQPDSASEPNWEFYQTELKSKSLSYIGGQSQVCKLAHVFFREFAHPDGRPGGITHSIVERASSGSGGSSASGTEFLFFKYERYQDFEQVIHPMYWDRGRGGYHHNVTGIGVKMFGAMEYQNRLICNGMNKAFAPKLFFRPASANAKEKMQLTTYEDYGIAPPGAEALQIPIQGYLNDQLAIMRVTDDLVRSNLSQYRTTVEPDKPGNPATKYEKQMQASQQSALTNTVFARWYKQRDALYAEIVRRLTNFNSTDERAKAFQTYCAKRGVPREALGRISQVSAVRVTGSGSPFVRQQLLQAMMPVIGGCSEEGQSNWRDDFIAAHVGASGVNRYNPKPFDKQLSSEQKAEATLQIAAAKNAIAPVVTPSQNPITFAGLFIAAATQALQSVKQGANPMEVLQFVDTLGPAIHQHIERMRKDPLRRQAVKVFAQQFKQLAKLIDQLKRMVAAQQKQKQAQQQKTARVMSEEQLANIQAAGDERRKNAKTRQQLMLKSLNARSNLRDAAARRGMADAETAARILREHRLAGLSE